MSFLPTIFREALKSKDLEKEILICMSHIIIERFSRTALKD